MRDKKNKMGDIAEIYATLVGRVDSAVTVLDHMIKQQSLDWFHVIQVMEMLKAALLEAEERYIEADEKSSGSHIVVIPAQNHGESVK